MPRLPQIGLLGRFVYGERAGAEPGKGNGGDGDGVAPGRPEGLSTFGGVFTPSILTILGVIMYLRLGWVVGSVGLFGALLIITISSVITFLTALSVAEIATDKVVRAGGAYYMISRSLGIETGGAVGIPLYIAQALSVALYTIGFAESVTRAFPAAPEKLVAVITTLGVAFLAWKSADLAIKAQYFIMAGIVLSLVSLVFGSALPGEPLGLADPGLATAEAGTEPAADGPGFWVVFAVFFPAVTGIMAGVNMSGDLREPNRAIPRGTLAAVGVGYVIYMALPVLLAFRVGADDLVQDPLVMRRIALWGDAILIGVWGATLSSAMGSILGAPRVLQALARDGVLPRRLQFLGAGSGSRDEPRVGTLVTLGVALLAVVFAELDLIAPVLTMFFLTTYLVLNVAAGVERFLDSPSFRPSFKVHWAFSLLGAVGCLAVMFILNWIATVAAALLILGVYVWLERRELQAAWGDVRNGLWMELVRAGLLRVEARPDLKNWRPHILVFSGAPTKRWNLVRLAAACTHNRGLVTVATVLPEEGARPGRRAELEATVRDYLHKNGIRALARVITASNRFEGGRVLVEAYGLGPLVPNTVLLGASTDHQRREEYCAMIESFHHAGRNVLILREDPERGFGRQRRIDVWWGGLQDNGGLMILLAYLLSTGGEWSGAEVRLKLVVPDETAAENARANLEKVTRRLRMGMVPDVLVSDGRPFSQTLRHGSVGADLVFLGVAAPGEGFGEYYATLEEWTAGLPSTCLVLAAPGLEFSRMLLEGSETADEVGEGGGAVGSETDGSAA